MYKRFLFILTCVILSSPVMSIETGGASWYGGKFQGRMTANGEIFDTNMFTAAHKTLPFNTIVEVTNLSNNKTVFVRINDRGPFVKGRIIDLSRAAAKKIGLVGKGVVQVRLRVISDTSELFSRLKTAALPGLKPPEKKLSNLVTIQVASFSSRENAERTKKILEENGFHPRFEFAPTGHIRILLADIPEKNTKEIRDKLRKLGFTAILLRVQKKE